MSDTNFVHRVTPIQADWLNDVNDHVYGSKRQVVLATETGADPTGATECSTLLQALIDTGKHLVLNGLFKINTPLQPTQAGISGVSPDVSGLLCDTCHGIQIPSTAGFDRPACVLEKFSINSVSNSCDDKFAIYVPGVASGAAAVYNSGLTIRDIEIGRTSRFGGGIYLKDIFRTNVENVGMTDVCWMIRMVGSVVQAKFYKVTSNNDSASLPGGGSLVTAKYGVTTESASYASGTLTPENIRAVDCSYIRGARGINHTSGLDVEFVNFDAETTDYGAFLNAECVLRGGIMIPQSTASNYIGVFRGVSPSDPDDGTLLDEVDVYATNTPGGTSYAFKFGDGVSPVYGIVMRNCRVRGNANAFAVGIHGRDLRDATIEDNWIRTAAVSGNDIDLTGRRIFLSKNRVPSGTIVVNDGGETTAYGEIKYNQCSTLTTTLTSPNQWSVMFNENLTQTRFFPHVLTASTTWDPASIAAEDATNTNVTVTGAAVGDAVVAGLAIGARNVLCSAHVSAADTVRVILHNDESTSQDISSGTLRVWVFKSS